MVDTIHRDSSVRPMLFKLASINQECMSHILFRENAITTEPNIMIIKTALSHLFFFFFTPKIHGTSETRAFEIINIWGMSGFRSPPSIFIFIFL